MQVDADMFFVGGIHGVGKTTTCKKLCVELGIKYLSASELIERHKQRGFLQNKDHEKRVFDIAQNQNHLISEFFLLKKQGEPHLLDGHFTLLGRDGEIKSVPADTFRSLSPGVIVVITDLPGAISRRLLKRDCVKVDIGFLKEMQDVELERARMIAQDTGAKFYEIAMTNIHKLGIILAEQLSDNRVAKS